MAQTPFNFSVHKTSESFIGNGSSREFSFTQIPILQKTDIQLLIYNTTTSTETLINYEDFTLNINETTNIGFTIILGNNITTPTSNEIIIAKLSRAIKNEIVFSNGSSPTPVELTQGFQGLCLSIATLLLNAKEQGLSFSISDIIENLETPLRFPTIDKNLDKMLLALRKNINNKYEVYYDNSLIENTYNIDIKEINDDYNLTISDNIIVFKENGPAEKKITFYKHLNITEGSAKYIKVVNMSANDLTIEFNNEIIDTAPKETTCMYKIDSTGEYSIVF